VRQDGGTSGTPPGTGQGLGAGAHRRGGSFKALRKGHQKTQAKVATTLGLGQESVPRLEQRSDMRLSTLREYVAAIGGSVRLLVEFKGKSAIGAQGPRRD
jgi:DNA-binding XRE family transcriptional regulator